MGNYIDNTQLEAMGVYIRRGGDGEVWSLPEREEPPHNDWHEVALRDADLLDLPTYADRTITLPLVVMRPTEARLEAVRQLFDHSPITLRVGPLGESYLLHPIGLREYRHRGTLREPRVGMPEVELEQRGEDFATHYRDLKATPRRGHARSIYSSGVQIGGTDLGALGIAVRRAYDTPLRGEIARHPRHARPSREIALRCSLIGEGPDELSGSLRALWDLLDRTGPLDLSLEGGESYPVYYKRMTETARRGRGVLDFTLILQTVYDDEED